MYLGDLITRNAHLYPNKTAFIYGDEEVTFSEYARNVYKLIHALEAKGIEQGDRMAILAKNCITYMNIYGAAEAGGRIIAPLNYRVTRDELLKLINECQPKILFVQKEYVQDIEAIRENLPTVQYFVALNDKREEWISYANLIDGADETPPRLVIKRDDVVYLIFTSGSTGTPRAVMLTHHGQLEDTKTFLTELRIGPHDKHLAMMPFYHIGEKSMVLLHFYRGCTTVILDSFYPQEVLEVIQNEKITTTQSVTTMINMLLEQDNLSSFDLSSLHLIFYSAAPMPVDLLKRALKVFGPVFMQGYGLTETGPLVTILHCEEHVLEGDERNVRRLASCGRAALNVEVRVVNELGKDVVPGEIGVIQSRSEFNMKGYWNRPQETSEVLTPEGWLISGDLATVDEDHYIYIMDRKKDMINSGGENIYPREVEEVLYTHPSVLEAAVIGVPDRKWGEAVKAVIVLKGKAQVSEDEIIEHTKKYLASYKKPKSIDFVSALPKSPNGKILKNEIRKKYWHNYERSV